MIQSWRCEDWLTRTGFQRANILKEVQIMRQLDHPNIVRLIDFSESQQFYYIVLELCPGGELFHQIVRLTYFSENLSRHVITQVARAIEYLHETSGVVHRYVSARSKPLLVPSSQLKRIMAAGTSNRRTYSSIPYLLFHRETPNLPLPAMKTRPMKGTLFLAWVQVALGR